MNTRLAAGVAALTLLVGAPADAGSAAGFCFDEAGAAYDVPPQLLRAIAWTESRFNRYAIHLNTDGSVDLGGFQIHESWLPKLKTYGITRQDLFDPCISSYVAAWISAQNIQAHGYNWTAVGAFNAKSPHKREKYARLVFASLRAPRN